MPSDLELAIVDVPLLYLPMAALRIMGGLEMAHSRSRLELFANIPPSSAHSRKLNGIPPMRPQDCRRRHNFLPVWAWWLEIRSTEAFERFWEAPEH